MRTKTSTKLSAFGAILLVIVLAGWMISLSPAYAQGGSAVITLSDGVENLPDGTTFTFRLYRVGGFDGPDFALEGAYAETGADVRIPNEEEYDPDDYDGMSWQEAWMDAANTLKTAVGADTASVGSVELAPGDTESIDVNQNGLYLLVGDPVIAGDTRWTPQPILISILNGDSEMTINNEVVVKLVSEKVVFEHSVAKFWNWSGDADAENPEDTEASVSQDVIDAVKPSEIKVEIRYGGEKIDTVTLNDENSWMYSWESLETGDTYKYREKGSNEWTTEFEPNEENPEWTVVEVRTIDENGAAADQPSADDVSRLRYFSVSYDKIPNGDAETFKITNTLIFKNIEIIKSLDGYDADQQNVTLSFVVTGKDAAGTEIYKNHVGMVFGPEQGLESRKVLTGIPADVQTIEVHEEYTGNYELDGKPEITYDSSSATWTVKMKNKHSGHGPGGGVVNSYMLGEDPQQDFGDEVPELN